MGFGTPMVVDDHADLVGGDDLADIVLDLLEVDFRLLDPRPRWGPDVQPKLARIDGRKKSRPMNGYSDSEENAKVRNTAITTRRWASAQSSAPRSLG